MVTEKQQKKEKTTKEKEKQIKNFTEKKEFRFDVAWMQHNKLDGK